MRVLVTGAAGFIGSHTVDLLLGRGHEVIALDALVPQVHGPDAQPRNLDVHRENTRLRFHRGDVRDRALLAPLVASADAVLHLAAAVGLGQSMYQPHHFCDVNVGGTALLLDLLANQPHSVKRLVVASSMSLYGESAYLCAKCGPRFPTDRSEVQLAAQEWEHRCGTCGELLRPVGTPESKPFHATTIYALTKQMQEELVLVFSAAYRIPAIALRYFNVYGPRQSLSNPYTGVAAIFLSRLRNRNAPLYFEDGGQSRDFIHVRDVARANVMALESTLAGQRVYNVGTGRAATVAEIAGLLGAALGVSIAPQIMHKFRTGDIRHCTADASRIADELGFRAEIELADGIRELVEWSCAEMPVDRVEQSLSELEARNLVK